MYIYRNSNGRIVASDVELLLRLKKNIRFID